MVIRKGNFTDFLACSRYPECRLTQSMNNGPIGSTTSVNCPEPSCRGDILEKRSRWGKVFYGCSRYPDCSFAICDKPVAKSCPVCKSGFMVEKPTKKKGTCLACRTPGCSHEERLDA